MDGIAEPPALPNVGDFVVLQQQGEGSTMKIEPASECSWRSSLELPSCWTLAMA